MNSTLLLPTLVATLPRRVKRFLHGRIKKVLRQRALAYRIAVRTKCYLFCFFIKIFNRIFSNSISREFVQFFALCSTKEA